MKSQTTRQHSNQLTVSPWASWARWEFRGGAAQSRSLVSIVLLDANGSETRRRPLGGVAITTLLRRRRRPSSDARRGSRRLVGRGGRPVKIKQMEIHMRLDLDSVTLGTPQGKKLNETEPSRVRWNGPAKRLEDERNWWRPTMTSRFLTCL